ncbi:dephospho-CoA kinase [Clostridium tarantellae]|uniref:Dephospho-CoA kinase n=1 Tax=Clostridium tarantellae TaxID=39493 RepID=A0A6I1MLJ5_9CLOT|nr:dephospho-CoA kinase [Clostridium tarantellae]MPQ44366.1 dephospho-CoA kinase [Clostridium tarantellae]
MIKIGLTGGICSGKSTISLMLKEAGFKIIDADIIAKEVLAKYPEILLKVRAEFGDNFFDWRGEFRRREFGNHIFRFPRERKKYEEIIIPYIKKDIISNFEELEKEGEVLVVLDGATLIENNFHEKMDMIVLVWVDENSQIQRIKFRDKLTQNEAINRINAQLSLDKKKEYANFIIDNSGNIMKTKEQILDLIDLLNLYK